MGITSTNTTERGFNAKTYKQNIKALRPRKFLRYRWWLLSIFIIGYLLTVTSFPDYFVEFSLLTLVNFSVLALLLIRLNKESLASVPVWVLLGIFFVGYFIKFYWFALDPTLSGGVHPLVAVLAASDKILIKSFAVLTLGFSVFSFVSFLYLVFPMRKRQEFSSYLDSSLRLSFKLKRFSLVLSWGLPLFIIIVMGAISWLGVSVMGRESVKLPYRIAGILYYIRFGVLPAFLVLFLWIDIVNKQHKPYLYGLIIALIFGLSDSFIRASRGSLVNVALLIGFLLLLTGRIRARNLQFLAILTAVTILLWPFISRYRVVQQDNSMPIITGITTTVESFTTKVDKGIEPSLSILVRRIIGVDSIIAMVGVGTEPIGLANADNVTRYFTNRVMRYPTSAVHLSAPSLVGYFYLMTGYTGIVVGVCSFTVIVLLLWRWLLVIKIISRPVAQTLFLWFLVTLSSEGTFDNLVYPSVALVAGMMLAEWSTWLAIRLK